MPVHIILLDYLEAFLQPGILKPSFCNLMNPGGRPRQCRTTHEAMAPWRCDERMYHRHLGYIAAIATYTTRFSRYSPYFGHNGDYSDRLLTSVDRGR